MGPKNPIRNLQRWQQVQSILLRYGFDILIDKNEVKEVRRFLKDKLYLSLGNFDDEGNMPENVRLMLQELGPTYIKLGQMLSSRSDLLPENWVTELAKLQDNVQPFSEEKAQEIIVRELGAPLDKLFTWFDSQPIAAASIGQVHQAGLPDGRPVVVKVQRPGIIPQVKSDMEIIGMIAQIVEERTAWGRRYGVIGIVEEFARNLNDELDYNNEARNAQQLRRNMASIPKVYVPFIHWDLVTPHVLTMERVQGVKINNLEALDEAGINRKKLADTFVRSMFKQILIDGFFHADPHPGNLFVNLENGKLIFLDLGMMGILMEEQQTELGNLVLAIQQHDAQEVVRAALSFGTAFGEVDELSLRRDVTRLLNRYLTAALSEISMSHLLSEMLHVLSKHHLRLPHELTLALKALIQAEEIARTLDPQIQIIEIARTLGEQLIWQRLNPRLLLMRFARDAQEMVRLAYRLPKSAEELLKQAKDGELSIRLEMPGMPKQIDHFYVIANRLTAGIVLAGMAIGSAIAMGVSPQSSWSFIPLIGVIAFIVSMSIGSALVWRVLMDLWWPR